MNTTWKNFILEPVDGIDTECVFDLPLVGTILCCNTVKKELDNLEVPDSIKEEILKRNHDIYIQYRMPENDNDLRELPKSMKESELLLNYLFFPHPLHTDEGIFRFDNIDRTRGYSIAICDNQFGHSERGYKNTASLFVDEPFSGYILKYRCPQISFHYKSDRRGSPISRQIRIAIELFNNSIRASEKAVSILNCALIVEAIVGIAAETASQRIEIVKNLLKSLPFVWVKDPPNTFEELFALFIECYGKRNAIVHGSGLHNKDGHISDEEVKGMQYIAYNIICNMACAVCGNAKLGSKGFRKKYLQTVEPVDPYLSIGRQDYGKVLRSVSWGNAVHLYYISRFIEYHRKDSIEGGATELPESHAVSRQQP